MLLALLKIFIPTAFAFFLGVLITPLATHFFYKHKMWKKRVRTEDTSSAEFKLVHQKKEGSEVSVPCVGGIIIWLSVGLSAVFFWLLPLVFEDNFFYELNFLSRSQTLLPLGIFFMGAGAGLIDDVLEIKGNTKITRKSGWYTKSKIFFVIFSGFLAGWWFFYKLGMESISIPFDGELYLGWLIVPLFILVAVSSFSGGVIDGIDGLSGGVLASIFSAYTLIAYTNGQMDLAALCGVITGSILAFLWFNIPPARFYMGETGMMPLTITLATLAFFTNTVLILPIVALPLVVTSFSSASQIIAKKYFGRRLFKVAPLHHHFEVIGWPTYKITMRYWVLSVVFSIIGIILSIISK